MTDKKQKLELTWIGKDEELKLEPRILIEDPNKSHGDPNSENMLIYGDNLLALKALEQDYAGLIKCIYIDPPYNTGSAFEHYDDNLQHSTWLNLMKPRLLILRKLLSDDGIIFIQIDDEEQAYLKVLMDEIFGREQFIGNFIWFGRSGKGGTSSNIANQHEYILCYGKTIQSTIKKEVRIAIGGNYSDEVGKYKREALRQWGQGDRRVDRPSMWYEILAPDGENIYPYKEDGTEGRWRVGQNTFKQLLIDNLIDFVLENSKWKVYKKIRDGRITGSVYGTLLLEYGTSATATAEIKTLYGSKSFETPKPEKLISHLINISSNPRDFVLDSFLGSGTTISVAHKMNRRWIGVEIGNHINTHCLPRLKKVVDGNDRLPLSEALDWKGGGGFKFYNLAPSLLRKDSFGNFVIDEQYNANMLAAAMCKHEGFRYSPDEAIYWKQGKSTETDYIFVTTGFVTKEQLDAVHAQMTENESLLICTKSFAPGSENHYSNITIKKIPQMILGKCEFAKDNYDLNIVKATIEETEESSEAQDE